MLFAQIAGCAVRSELFYAACGDVRVWRIGDKVRIQVAGQHGDAVELDGQELDALIAVLVQAGRQDG